MIYIVERERWISKEDPEHQSILRGYDETYFEEVEADYFGVDEHGTAMFYRKNTNPYQVSIVASYAEGHWHSIKEKEQEQDDEKV